MHKNQRDSRTELGLYFCLKGAYTNDQGVFVVTVVLLANDEPTKKNDICQLLLRKSLKSPPFNIELTVASILAAFKISLNKSKGGCFYQLKNTYK